MSATPPPPVYPHRFGPYVIVCPIGIGSMGTVFGALMGTKGREKLCVIKKMAPEALEVPNARERVHREGEIARQLSHGAIAQTFAVGEAEGAPYLVQEFVHGWSLNRLLADCAEFTLWPSIPLACHIVREVARALAYVHTAGVVHRDIAPENVMISYTGEVKVIDFGIAKVADEEPVTGTLVGRHTYGAPETLTHASLSAADARSDLYGLGVILWSLLAHRRDPDPFLHERRPTAQVEDATIEAPPSPSMFNPEVARELDGVVMRTLAYLPEDRYQTANELQAAVGRFIPSGYVGEEEIKRFLRRHTDPTFARKILKEAIEHGKDMLPDAPPTGGPESPSKAPRQGGAALRIVRAKERVSTEPATAFAGIIDPEPKESVVPRGLVVRAREREHAPQPAKALVEAEPTSKAKQPSRRRLYVAAAFTAVVLGVGSAALFVTRPGAGTQPHVNSRSVAPASKPAAAAPPPIIVAPRSSNIAVVDGPTIPAATVDLPIGCPAKLPTLNTERRKMTTFPPQQALRVKRSSEASPRPVVAASAGSELLEVAQSSLAQNRLDQAVELGRRAVVAGAGAPAHLLVGTALMKQRRYADAERAFAEAASLDPGNKLARERLRKAREQLAASPATTSLERSE
jgi:eukaryotic-like serine/threonine-protein kinase